MKKIIMICLALSLLFTATAFAQEEDTMQPTNILVAVFSRAGENYNVGTVNPDSVSSAYAGYVERGNTEIFAETIAELTGGDLFAIRPVTPYPDDYASMLTVSSNEFASDARPEIADSVENWEQYDVIFVGYPIWHGEMPMILHTFLESYDFTGKTVIPFNTHEGSGQSGTVSVIRSILPDSEVLDGKAVQGKAAQEMSDATRDEILTWLQGMGYAQ